ncbi:MAG: PilZ domain-containing protein [Thermodesulfobacteriota bacterium]
MSDIEKKEWDKIPSLNLEMDDAYADRLKEKDGRRHRRTDIAGLKSVLKGDVSSIPIRIATAADGVFDGIILDISESGCRVAVRKKLKKDELAKLGFTINERAVITKAIARWISDEDYGCSAGLEFQGISGDLKEFLGTISSASLFNKVGQVK